MNIKRNGYFELFVNGCVQFFCVLFSRVAHERGSLLFSKFVQFSFALTGVFDVQVTYMLRLYRDGETEEMLNGMGHSG